MSQQTFDNNDDDFVKSLNLTDEKIREDLEKMRDIEGFPLGDVEDILELSEPPYYTAYPNPYIKDFIEYYGTPYYEETDEYDVEHYVNDIIEGKNDPIYRAHSYHTKVPPKAIEEFIKHYSEPGDIIFDGFCGSGMTGVASLYSNRNCISVDLASAAGFLSFNYNSKISGSYFNDIVEKVLKELNQQYHWMFETRHNDGQMGYINYIVWSDELICPYCNNKFLYWDVAIDLEKGLTKKDYNCPHCNAIINNKKAKKSKIKFYDDLISKEVVQTNQVPVYINYTVKNKRYNKKLDDYDKKLIKKIENYKIPFWVPVNELPKGDNTSQPINSHGFTHVHHFYSKRNLIILATFNDIIKKYDIHNNLKILMTAVLRTITKCNRFTITKRKPQGEITGPLSGTLYIPPVTVERNGLLLLSSKKKEVMNMFNFEKKSNSIISNQSSTDLSNFPKNSIDYIFIDPPFGSNIMYSEMNFLYESWLKLFTDNTNEAIVNKCQNKTNEEYTELMENCFSEFYKILKPNRWITVEFHNSKAEIWKIIQNSIINAGFVVSHVAVLNKVQGTIHQDSKIDTSVKNDLIINAYKPKESFSSNFLKSAGLNMELEFIEMHLNKLPILDNVNRTRHMLYSRLLAYYIQNKFEVRMDSTNFYELLNNHFEERDGLWFTQNQVLLYEEHCKNSLDINIGDNQQILGIFNEKDLLLWLSQFLKTPKTYDEIYVEYSKKSMTSDDLIPELKLVLNENFIKEKNKYRLPSSSERKQKESLRNKHLSKEFDLILDSIKTKNKIKEVRKEALFYGLMELYNDKNVEIIQLIDKNIDKKIIESDEDISAIINWARYK